MDNVLITRTQSGDIRVIVPRFFSDSKHTEPPYREGLYAQYGNKPVRNIWTSNRMCSDLLEFMFNNEFNPVAATDPMTGKRLPFLDGSGANAIRNLGSMKNIWKQFEMDYRLSTFPVSALSIEWAEKEFWDYYIKKNAMRFENSVHILQNYVMSRRTMMTEDDVVAEYAFNPILSDDDTWMQGCRDFIRHLVYRTPRGYILELILMVILSECVGGSYEESTPDDERKGIDGYIVFGGNRAPVSLKPASYRTSKVSPVNKGCFVTYDKRNQSSDLAFTIYGTGVIQSAILRGGSNETK